MSVTKNLTELAVGFAAGDYTEDALHEMLGDDNAVASVVSIAAGLAGAGVAVAVTRKILDTEIVTDVTDVVDDVFGSVGDVVSSINPFSGW